MSLVFADAATAGPTSVPDEPRVKASCDGIIDQEGLSRMINPSLLHLQTQLYTKNKFSNIMTDHHLTHAMTDHHLTHAVVIKTVDLMNC